jgi:hypothetical protein
VELFIFAIRPASLILFPVNAVFRAKFHSFFDFVRIVVLQITYLQIAAAFREPKNLWSNLDTSATF